MERASLGQRLHQARATSGLSLREIEAATKIAVPVLEALERGEFSKLPGGLYSRSFVRAFASHVGIDPDEAARDFQAELAVQERQAATIRIHPAITDDDRAFLARQQRAMRLARAGAIVGALLLVVAIGWAVSRWWPVGDPAPAEPAPVPQVTRQAPTPPPPADPVVARPPNSLQAERERLSAVITVTAECWVQATADGLVVLSRILRPGDRETVTANRELVLDVGNAGAFEWTLNGRPAQALGREGRRREITITRENAATFVR